MRAINVKRLAMWEMTDEKEETYGDVMPFDKRLMTYKDTPSVGEAELYGCGVLVAVASRNSGGSLELGIHGLTGDEREVMYGENIVGGTNVTSAEDVPSYVAVAVMSENEDGTVNLRKWFKVRFSPHDESISQIEGDKISFSTPTVKGTYVVNSTDWIRASRDDVDTVEDAEFINKWFTDADYIGGETDEGV